MKMTIKILLICFLMFSLNLLSKDYTKLSIVGGAGFSLNNYFSDFKELKGYPNCCNSFDYASGIGFYVFTGAEWNGKLSFLGNDAYGIGLSYNDYSAAYKINEYIGNDIQGNSYRKIYVDNNLNVNWGIVGLNPYIVYNLMPDIVPLQLRIGFSAGIPITKSFRQEEVLVSPSDLIFENGSKYQYQYNGNLPDASSLYLGLDLGFSFTAYSQDGLNISPELFFNYSLISPVASYNWNNLAVKAGFSISYNIPEKAPERLQAAPLPNPHLPIAPEPPAPPVLSLSVFDNLKSYSTNDTITAVFEYENYNYMLSYIPVLFYEKNESIPKNSQLIINSEQNDLNFFEIIKKGNFSENYADIIAEYYNNKNIKISLIAQSSDDSDEILQSRLNIIKSKLIDKGIKPNDISISKKAVNLKNENRKELIDETRRVNIKFSDGSDLVSASVIKDKVDYKFNKGLVIVPTVNSESPILKFTGYSQFNNGDKNYFDYKTNDILLSASLFESVVNKANELKISAYVEDSLGKSDSKEILVYLNNTKKIKNKFLNITDKDNSALIMGYFNFDSFTFSSIDNNVLFYLKDKIKDTNLEIEIIPSTDNLGSTDYNQNLAEQRAKAAIALLKLNPNKLPTNIKVKFPESEIFSNASPYGRFLNRSVIINIRKR